MKALEQIKTVIRCDNPPCDWSVKAAGEEQFLQYLDVRCPKCEGPKVLITEEDVKAYAAMVASVDMLAKYMPESPDGAEMDMACLKIKDGKIQDIELGDNGNRN